MAELVTRSVAAVLAGSFFWGLPLLSLGASGALGSGWFEKRRSNGRAHCAVGAAAVLAGSFLWALPLLSLRASGALGSGWFEKRRSNGRARYAVGGGCACGFFFSGPW